MSLQQGKFFLSAKRSLLAAMVTSMFALTAHAGLLEDDEARRAILELRQKSDFSAQRLSDEVKKSADDNTALRRSLLDLSNQIEMLRTELAKQRGQDEQLARTVSELQRQQKDMALGVEERMKKFEPSKVLVDGQEFIAAPAEVRDFDAALASLRQGEFAAAQTAFMAFDKRYPNSGYNPSMLFWLGNAQYALRNYKDAIVNFKALLTAAPVHLRAPEAALSIANCQIELKDGKSARKTLEDILKVYPQSEAAGVAKTRLAQLK
jgi:tol-pal system protein YbgF